MLERFRGYVDNVGKELVVLRGNSTPFNEGTCNKTNLAALFRVLRSFAFLLSESGEKLDFSVVLSYNTSD